MLTITLILLPVSYVMNRYIYHHWAMRGLLAVLAGVLLPITWIAMFFRPSTHYFGLLPLWRSGGAGVVEGWWAWLWRSIDLLKHPFVEQMGAPDDAEGWTATLGGLLVSEGELKKGQKVVPEALWEATRALAVIPGQGEWQAEHDRLKASLTPPAPAGATMTGVE